MLDIQDHEKKKFLMLVSKYSSGSSNGSGIVVFFNNKIYINIDFCNDFGSFEYL